MTEEREEKKKRVDEALGLVLTPLRKAMLDEGIDEPLIVKELKKLLTGQSLQAKAKAIEIISRWGQFNSDNLVISEDTIKISNAPEDLDI